MIKIAPSILAADFSKLGEQVLEVERAGADYLHIDVMDGNFVPNISFGSVVIKSIRQKSNLVFDVHLMINEPEKYIADFAEAGADIITVHAEATNHLHRCIQQIKSFSKKAGVSLNPATPLCMIENILDEVDLILIMSVNPGFGGQKYIKASTQKIENLKKMIGDRNIEIQVDGGITLSNIYEVTKAGASVIVAGTTVFGAENIKETIKLLKEKSYGETV